MTAIQKIHAVMKECDAVQKAGQFTQGASFKYHRHDDVTWTLRQGMVKHGLVMSVECGEMTRTDRLTAFSVSAMFHDVDDPTGPPVVCSCPAEASAKGKTQVADDKQIGVALSYAVKNIMLKVFMLTDMQSPIPDAEDRENERAGEEQRAQAPAARPAGPNPFQPAMPPKLRDDYLPDGSPVPAPIVDSRDGSQDPLGWGNICNDLLVMAKQDADIVAADPDNIISIGQIEQRLAEAMDVFKAQSESLGPQVIADLQRLGGEADAALGRAKAAKAAAQ